MADKVRTRAGAVLLHRLGPLRLGEQSRWDRAPQPRGMWAFPWPHFEMFFAYHQYENAMPKRLLRHNDGWPAHLSGFSTEDGSPIPDGLTRDDVVAAMRDDYYNCPYRIRDGWHNERDAWVDQTGRRVVAKRTFWHPGLLYTHLTERGDVLPLDEWRLMPAVNFAAAVRRSGGANMTYKDQHGLLRRTRTSADHLEVFIPAGSRR